MKTFIARNAHYSCEAYGNELIDEEWRRQREIESKISKFFARDKKRDN